MRVIRVTTDLTASDLAAETAFFVECLGLDVEDMGLDWVTRVVVPSSGEHVQLVSRDETGPENPVVTVKVDDVDEAYALAQRLGHDIVHPLTTEAWGIRRFFVRTPGGSVLNIAQHHEPGDTYPALLHTAIDARDCRGLAEFYRELLGLRYRPGDEPPTDGSEDDADWLVLVDAEGRRVLAVQQKVDLTPSTWPSEEVPMQLHMDFRLPSVAELERHRARAEALGARLLHDRSRDGEEPLLVLADPAGHPFCLLVQLA